MIDDKWNIVGYWTDPTFHDFLRTPNQGVIWLRDLRYGRSLYEEIICCKPHLHPENERYYARRPEFGKGSIWWLKPDWRQLLPSPDPHARQFLCNDPTREWLPDDLRPPNMSYVADYHLWEPDYAMELLLDDGPTMSHILKIMDRRIDDKLRLRFQTHLIRFFRETYLPASHRNFGETFYWACPDQATHDKKAARFWENYVERIANCLLNNFQIEPDLWFPAMLKADELDKHNHKFVTPGMKPKVQFVKKVLP